MMYSKCFIISLGLKLENNIRRHQPWSRPKLLLIMKLMINPKKRVAVELYKFFLEL